MEMVDFCQVARVLRGRLCAGYVLSLYAYLITPLGVPQGYIRVNYRQWPSTVVIQSIILIIDYQVFLCTW